MILNKKIVLPLLLSIVYASQARAQVFDDWEARTSLSLKYKMNKNWSIAGTYYMYLDHKLSEYDQSEAGAEIGYKVNSWLKVGVDYRYGMKSNKHSHDIRYTGAFDYHPAEKWKLVYRAMVQQEFTSLRKAHLVERPVEYYLRNRLTVAYELTRSISLYLFTENYLQPAHGDLFFYRQKSGIGAEFEIKERSEIETRFEIKNKNSGKNNARIILGYTYTFGRKN